MADGERTAARAAMLDNEIGVAYQTSLPPPHSSFIPFIGTETTDRDTSLEYFRYTSIFLSVAHL